MEDARSIRCGYTGVMAYSRCPLSTPRLCFDRKWDRMPGGGRYTRYVLSRFDGGSRKLARCLGLRSKRLQGMGLKRAERYRL